MYSNNDFRSYQELYHAEEKKKAKWPWLPGGKNTPEYNHWYYMTHPEKWGITKAGQQAVDAVKKGVDDFTNWTETDLDNKAVDALSRGYNTAKNAVTNTNTYKTAKSAYGDVRKATEAMQRRDDAARRADNYSSKADAENKKYQEYQTNRHTGNYYAQKTAAQTKKSAEQSKNYSDRYNRFADYNRSEAAKENSRANGYLDRAKNTATSAVRNTVGNAVDSARLGAQELGSRVSTGVKNATNTLKSIPKKITDSTNTTIDDNLRRAAESALSGRGKEAGYYARSAASTAANGVKNALGTAVKNVSDAASKVKNAGEAYGAYRKLEKANRDYEANPTSQNRAKQRIAQREFDKERQDEGGEIGVRAGDARNNLINTAKVAKANTQNMVGTAKNNSIIAAQRASKSVKDIYDKAMKELGDIRDKYGQNSPQYLEALKDLKQDAIQAVTSTGSSIRTAFQNAPGTVMSVMSSGAEWISNTFDGLISREEQILMSPEAEERQRQQQNTKLSGRYTDFDYENDEAERRRNESQKKR